MKVKICGITDEKTAFAAVDAGADALGFVFTTSKRKIEIEKARDIIQKLPNRVMKVGVFVNASKAEIERIAAMVGLTHIQLHGDESPEFVRNLSLPVIKAFSVQDEQSIERIREFPCEFVLLDGPKGKYRGGNGLAFDWTILAGADLPGKKLILAGGLTSDNVETAIQQIHPYMVDVSSGVETEGKKDLQKVRQFLEKVKGGFQKERKKSFASKNSVI